MKVSIPDTCFSYIDSNWICNSLDLYSCQFRVKMIEIIVLQ